MQVFASLWSADLLDLGRAIDLVGGVADGFHLDVFDGHNVDDLLFGPDFVAAVRRRTDRPLDIHLNVTAPDHWAPRFIDVGADMITVQESVCPDVAATLAAIQSQGVAASLGVETHESPPAAAGYADSVDRFLLMGTRIGVKGQTLDERAPDRIKELRAHAAGDVTIFVDGGIRAETVPLLAQAGADGVIPGSLVFADADPVAVITHLHGLTGARKAS